MGIKRSIGVAVDLGTTTVAAAAVDLETGSVVARMGAPNPQSEWGSDVLSRVEAIVGDAANLGRMSAAVAQAINVLISNMVSPDDVCRVHVAGNTIMEHIFLGVSPAPLARVPYKPVFTEARVARAEDLGISAAPGAKAYLFPSVGGFVGGDAVAVMLALGFGLRDTVDLAIDIGTNSEIMLCSAGRFFAASAAAGPAFEAGGVGAGMIAARGAIERVTIAGDDVILGVIGGASPRGICGSGLISAVSSMIGAGVIDNSGRIVDRVELDTNLGNRIQNEVSGSSFSLYRASGSDIKLTQADIRNLQNAKAAIRAGISMLLEKAGITADLVDKVYIAGAFGSNLDTKDLARIGVLDRSWVDKVELAGDGALDGVVMALTSGHEQTRAEKIARDAKYVSLSGSAHFEKEFLRNMGF